MFEFKTPVKLYGNAPPAEIVARLSTLTAAPFSFKKCERVKPLRGKLLLSNGSLRWALNEYRVSSPRTLEFSILEASSGTMLMGELRLWSAFRIVVLTWLTCGNLLWLWIIICDLLHRAPVMRLRDDVLVLTMCWGMASGYLWFAVAVGRHRDQSLIRLLRVVLASQTGATAAKQLLSPDDRKRSFIDEPPILETK